MPPSLMTVLGGGERGECDNDGNGGGSDGGGGSGGMVVVVLVTCSAYSNTALVICRGTMLAVATAVHC